MTDLEAPFVHLIDQIFAVNGGLLQKGDQLARPFHLTAAQWQVLGYLQDHPATVSEVARRRGLKRQGVQETVNRLVAAGMLEARPQPHDARASIFVVTAGAQQILEQLSHERDAWTEQMTAALAPEDLEITLRTLVRLRELLGVPSRTP